MGLNVLTVCLSLSLYCVPVKGQGDYGVWSKWGEWGSCDVACSGGIQTRSRNCTESEFCIGPGSSNQTCNTQVCSTGLEAWKVAVLVAVPVIVVFLAIFFAVQFCQRKVCQKRPTHRIVYRSVNQQRTKAARKVIIDTDAGVDDAQAILMALAYPHVLDVVAITTVHGNTSCKNVTLNVLRLLKVANRQDIPVYKGAAKPLAGERIKASYYHGKDGFGDVPDLSAPGMDHVQSESALEALLRLSKDYSGELELICIGPLTNIAQVIQKDPGFSSKIKHCYIMGGNYKGVGNIKPHAEFNFYADPEAANTVLTKLGCDITMVCWELVKSCPFSWDWYYKTYMSASTKKAKFIKKIEAKTIAKFYKNPEFKKDGYETPDQIAVAMALNADICVASKKASASVECKGENARGKMKVDYTSKGVRQNITILTELDKKQYASILESYLKA